MENRITSESLISIFRKTRVTGLKAVLFLTLTLPLFVDLLYCLIIEWQDFFKRLLTLKEIMVILFSAIGGYFVQFHMQDIEEKYIIKYLENANKHQTSEAKIKIVDDTNQYIIRHNIISIRAFMFLFISGGCIPLLQIIIKLLKMYLTGREVEKMAFVLHLCLPEGYNTPGTYFFVQLVAFTMYGIVIYMWGNNYKIFMISMKCISTEVCLLIESLRGMDIYQARPALMEDEGQGQFEGHSTVKDEALKDHLRNVIAEHQEVLRSLKLVNDRAKFYIFLFINVYSIQLCLYIIFILKLKELSQKMKYAFTYAIILFIQLQWAIYAQDIQDNGEKLRTALYNVPWLDKPQWLKKSLILMMLKANQPLELAPYGLYALNKRCMANMIKVTYTYVNVVNELLSRK